jgi:hypothetical protein
MCLPFRAFGWRLSKNLVCEVEGRVNCRVRFPRIEKRKLAKIARAAGQKAKDAGKFVYRHRKEIFEVLLAIWGAVAAGRGGRSGRRRKR